MDVDLVLEEDGLSRARTPLQFSQFPDPPPTAGRPPGAGHDRPGAAPAYLQVPQHLPHMSDRDADIEFLGRHPGQQLQGPGSPREPERARRRLEDFHQAVLDILVDLPLPVLGPAVVQRHFVLGQEARYDPGGGRRGTTDFPGGRSTREPLIHLEDDAAADAKIGVAGLAVESLQASPSGARQSESSSHRGTSLFPGLALTPPEKQVRSHAVKPRIPYGLPDFTTPGDFDSCEAI